MYGGNIWRGNARDFRLLIYPLVPHNIIYQKVIAIHTKARKNAGKTLFDPERETLSGSPRNPAQNAVPAAGTFQKLKVLKFVQNDNKKTL